ncbi:WYL domain-containing protein [Sulfurovum mangrovi]|uniref:WYL domain-containing protein n=1 Tax=Sulfurovum mangrovi TaxID=2893889 RepID=UPI001E460852|nr:WYL domain-containing protein [Sulfurovum mangrovi]UFH58344.1 WYL domain-containing protein [Sulfurovum mangrovi]
MGTQDPINLLYYIPDVINELNSTGRVALSSLRGLLQSEKDDHKWVEGQIDRIRREVQAVLKFHYKNNSPIKKGFQSNTGFLSKSSDPKSMYLEYLVYGELRQLGNKGKHILEKLEYIVAKQIKDKERYASIQAMLKMDQDEQLLERFTTLKNAIHDKNEITFLYAKDNYYEVFPIQLINLEYFWYLQCEDKENGKIWNAKLSRIGEIWIGESFKDLNKDYSNLLNTSKYAINAFHAPNTHLSQEVILHLHSNIKPSFFELPFFEEGKNIKLIKSSNTKPGYTTIKLFVSNAAEVLLIIQAYQPNIIVESPKCLKNYVKIASFMTLNEDHNIEFADIGKLKENCEEAYGDNSDIVKKYLK